MMAEEEERRVFRFVLSYFRVNQTSYNLRFIANIYRQVTDKCNQQN